MLKFGTQLLAKVTFSTDQQKYYTFLSVFVQFQKGLIMPKLGQYYGNGSTTQHERAQRVQQAQHQRSRP
ncbi:MAG: hypothetical protein K2N56_12580, partial [Oscillospiraceae bacterium]|nr:hypothetical protein [Oscillospiraceae bacterium]